MSFVNSLNAGEESAIIGTSPEVNQNAYLEKLIDEIFKTDNISIRSDLTKEQNFVFAKAELYAEEFGVPIVNKFLNYYMTLALSKNRASRKELVDISRSLKSEDSIPTVTEKLLGK